ncbi:MAG: hypothetical protein WBV95_14750, partial [Desulfobacterales bacterium]
AAHKRIAIHDGVKSIRCPVSGAEADSHPYIVHNHGFIEGPDKFPIQKCAIFRKFKEIGGIARRQTVLYAAQAIP